MGAGLYPLPGGRAGRAGFHGPLASPFLRRRGVPGELAFAGIGRDAGEPQLCAGLRPLLAYDGASRPGTRPPHRSRRPVELAFYLPAATGPGRQDHRVASRSLVTR